MTRIEEAKHCIVFAMYDEARIDAIDETTVVKYMTDDAFIGIMRDGSKVEETPGYAKIKRNA
ncbi:MAG: hypothetical protein U5L95_02630 [Candidatus Saccharibacteria bacterium]|nr:hypothetical protein [Candidatus Saccharibacteria bacterium]